MRISLIVAASQDWVIGRDGDMPWRLSSDLKRFKSLTMGHPMIMGRKTYESIGRLLPGRTTIILTRDPNYVVEGAEIAHTVGEAIAACEAADEAFVVGGAEIYTALLPWATRLYLTKVHALIPDGDTHFPLVNFNEWELESSEEIPADEKNLYPTRFEVWDRLPIAD
ncbi:dihydrofolate reductase [Blastopirellula marina]|uniref:Dihydrofolate reductase n=1 Tax=Blastopirellula marina TaxID=124 RepID=A0A2S8FML2_9BACT|nr:dihydrofolate reductase [Blastopirellula marina]PQO33094.1 diacylglycerol kinase [Blastopirellula marina]PTL43261.1 dihydrofolate reductase [Blastopirellula marina]